MNHSPERIEKVKELRPIVRSGRKALWHNLSEKLKEALFAVLPISAIVLLLHFTVAPLSKSTVWLFLCGMVLLILGMGLFTLGADMSMMPVGERIGAQLTKSRNIKLLVVISFIMGVAITIAEPDLQVLATQIPSIPNSVLVGAVATGVGVFLVLAVLRIVLAKRLAPILLVLYAAVFVLAIFAPSEYLAIAFDSGGVTTGPITVPFILSLGVGIAAVRGGSKDSENDSFGLVALSSVGPIIAVLLLSIFYPSSPTYTSTTTTSVSTFQEALSLFVQEMPHYAKEVLSAILPIAIFFVLFQLLLLHLPRRQTIKAGVGLVYTFLGLVLFLCGVNVGFLPAGKELGTVIASLPNNWILVPIGMVLGLFVVLAEPAVHVLTKQVTEVTGGSVSRNSILACLSIGVSFSVGISMVRVLTGLSIWYCLIPGYAISLILAFIVPPVFTGIAFDSGGVASGPMTACFILPFAMGACEAVGGNVLTDAFGVVAMVAMTPLITIQILGLIYKLRTPAKEEDAPVAATIDIYPDVVEL